MLVSLLVFWFALHAILANVGIGLFLNSIFRTHKLSAALGVSLQCLLFLRSTQVTEMPSRDSLGAGGDLCPVAGAAADPQDQLSSGLLQHEEHCQAHRRGS